LYSFCDYRMQFCRGELKELPRTIGSSLFIAMKVTSLFNLRLSLVGCQLNVGGDRAWCYAY
jgi:hypothetical protein